MDNLRATIGRASISPDAAGILANHFMVTVTGKCDRKFRHVLDYTIYPQWTQ